MPGPSSSNAVALELAGQPRPSLSSDGWFGLPGSNHTRGALCDAVLASARSAARDVRPFSAAHATLFRSQDRTARFVRRILSPLLATEPAHAHPRPARWHELGIDAALLPSAQRRRARAPGRSALGEVAALQ